MYLGGWMRRGSLWLGGGLWRSCVLYTQAERDEKERARLWNPPHLGKTLLVRYLAEQLCVFVPLPGMFTVTRARMEAHAPLKMTKLIFQTRRFFQLMGRLTALGESAIPPHPAPLDSTRQNLSVKMKSRWMICRAFSFSISRSTSLLLQPQMRVKLDVGFGNQRHLNTELFKGSFSDELAVRGGKPSEPF